VQTGKRSFLLDANVFIEAKRRYYAFDLCPGFWECLKAHHAEGRIYSIDRIFNELADGADDLADWATEMPSGYFLSTEDESVTDGYREVVSWVNGQKQFKEEVKAEFLAIADGWLIAYAKQKGMVVVTHEVYAPDARNKIPMPNICRGFNIDHADTFDMLRELGVQFHWKRDRAT
jgi:hypothetical protein